MFVGEATKGQWWPCVPGRLPASSADGCGEEAISGSQRVLVPAVRGGREGEVALEQDCILLSRVH